MLKKILYGLLVVALLILVEVPPNGAAAQNCPITVSDSDDFIIVCQSRNISRTSLSIGQSANINQTNTFISNTGGNFIVAGHDVESGTADITSGDVNLNIRQRSRINRVSLTFN